MNGGLEKCYATKFGKSIFFFNFFFLSALFVPCPAKSVWLHGCTINEGKTKYMYVGCGTDPHCDWYRTVYILESGVVYLLWNSNQLFQWNFLRNRQENHSCKRVLLLFDCILEKWLKKKNEIVQNFNLTSTNVCLDNQKKRSD